MLVLTRGVAGLGRPISITPAYRVVTSDDGVGIGNQYGVKLIRTYQAGGARSGCVRDQTPAHQGAILLRLGLGRKNARLIQSPQIKTGKFTEEETARGTAVPFLKSPK